MRKTLEDFYYGNLRPSDQQMTVNSKLQRAVDTVVQRESQLEEQMDDEGKKLLSEFSDAQRTVDSITALENFILGFRLGVRIMAECMDHNDGSIRIRGE